MEAKDSLGRITLSEQDCIDLLLNGIQLQNVYVDDKSVSEKYNRKNDEYFRYDSVLSVKEDVSFEEFHQNNVDTWFMPDKYKNIDVREYVLDRVSTDEERERVEMEYAMYKERDLDDVLRLMIFLIEFFRENDIVWGVGRGSSVASYILYIIGVHKVNSILYDLDINEFLK
jgi:DNA polymerase III alpha subunit